MENSPQKRPQGLLSHILYTLFWRIIHPLRSQKAFILFMVLLSGISVGIVHRPHDHFLHYFLCWGIDIYLLALLIDICPPRMARLCKILLYGIAYLTAIVEIYLFLRFNLLISPTVLTLLKETNSTEIGEFLHGTIRSKAFGQTGIIFLPLILLNVCVERWGREIRRSLYTLLSGLPLYHSVQVLKILFRRVSAIALCLLLSTGFGNWLSEKRALISFMLNTQSDGAEKIPERHFFTPYYRTMLSMHLASMAHHEIDKTLANMARMHIDSCAKTCPNIVVVIGESYNKHHASLYGYGLPTTPLLSARQTAGELIVFEDVTTPWNLTSNAFKAFLSTHSSDTPGNWTNGILFPAIFRRAGYRVAFVTNQFFKSASQSAIDFNGSFFLNDSRLDSLCFDYRNSFRSNDDMGITTLLARYTPAAHNLYLLHLWGQHMEYDHRFPKKCTIFHASQYRCPELNLTQRRIVAAYDNATHYNDKVLNSIFNYFSRQDAIVIYFADHGEEVYDDGVLQYGRCHDDHPSEAIIRHEYEIPFLIWGSPTFQKRHPRLFDRLRKARLFPFSHDDLPHLLLGLASIATPCYDATRDPLSPQFKAHHRMLRGGTIDYDSIKALHSH